MTGGNHANNRAISVWFLCKSCGFTFHFQHVDEFLEHKKQVHFSEFAKIRCIVFEEKLDDTPEHDPDQAPEILGSALFQVDKVDRPEGEVECFWESETKPSASISTNDVISQDSQDGNELLRDTQLLSLCDLPHRRLGSPVLQLTQRNKIEELPRPTTECLNGTSLLAIPTIIPTDHENDELLGDSTTQARESNTVNSNISLPTIVNSNPNRIVSFTTDQTEENGFIVEISNSQTVIRSSDSPNDSSFQIQFCSESGSGISALVDLSNSNISSDKGLLTNELAPSSEAILEPSLISSHNSVIDEVEDAAAIDATDEIYEDLETVVHNDAINLKLDVDSSGLSISDENIVKEKTRTNSNTTSKYNPYVLVKRLQLTDRPIGPEKHALYKLFDLDTDEDQPCSPQDSSSCSDGDMPSTKFQILKNSPKRKRYQRRDAFIFPSPESDSEDENDPLPLKDWLLHQRETTGTDSDSNDTKKVILLDPDPTIEDIGAITSESPITCKLCCEKLTSEPKLKVHVKHCWLFNKKLHRLCVICMKSYSRTHSLREHYAVVHGAGIDNVGKRWKLLKCQYCPREFGNTLTLKNHEDTHPEKPQILKPFACKLCNQSFYARSKLRHHSLSHSNDRPFKCEHPNCPFAAKTATALKLHSKSHENPLRKLQNVQFQFPYFQIPEGGNGSDHMTLADWVAKQTEEVEGTPTNVIMLEPDPTKQTVGPISQESYISCKLCCEKLTSEARVKVHVTYCWLQNKGRHRYCISCDKKVSNNASLREHSARTHGTEEEREKLRSFKCKQCPKSYWQERDLLAHLETHKSKEEQNRPFVCETCGLRFFQLKVLRLHVQTHSSERPFKCLHPNCTQSFKTKLGHHLHMKTHSDLRPHECQYPGCSKSFKTGRNLKTHSLVHEGKSYECTHESCRKKFASSGKLKRHIKVRHTEGGIKKKFECNICHKKFALKCNLKQHAPIHLNLKEKPFKCSHEGCQEAFNIKRILDEHERKHTGELPFVCDSCGKAYAKEWSFRKHLRVHENAHNKHPCPNCPRKFPGTWELKQHLLIHEKGKQFICSQCGKECMTKANLNLHQKTHSKGNVRKSGKIKNSKKVETSSESESLNESLSEDEESTEASTQSDKEI